VVCRTACGSAACIDGDGLETRATSLQRLVSHPRRCREIALISGFTESRRGSRITYIQVSAGAAVLDDFSTETDARRNHDVLGELCSLSYQPTFIDVCVTAGGGNFQHTLKLTTCQILVFVITVMFLDNENYKLLLIIPCKIENMA